MLPIPLFVPGADAEKIEQAKANRKKHFPWRDLIRTDDFTCCKCDVMFVDDGCHDHRNLRDERVICHLCYVKAGGVDLQG